MKNLVLIGLPGCGKTTVGRLAAAELGMPFFDCDDAVEAAAGKAIPDIFAADGEDAFRVWEKRCLRALLRPGGRVIAAGGGAVLTAENRRLLEREFTVFLDRTPEEIMSTANLDGRPLLAHTSLAELSAARRPLYLACADATVAGVTPDDAAAAVAAHWRERICAF